MATKICTVCTLELPEESFNLDKSIKCGRCSKCKECQRKYFQKWRNDVRENGLRRTGKPCSLDMRKKEDKGEMPSEAWGGAAFKRVCDSIPPPDLTSWSVAREKYLEILSAPRADLGKLEKE